MLSEMRDRIKNYFMEWNPVEISDVERKVKAIVPPKEKVIGGNEDPITTKEVQEKCNREYDMKKETARRKLYTLRDKGLVEEIRSSEWVNSGKNRRLSEEKLKNLFMFISIVLIFSSFFSGTAWPVYTSAVLLIISVILFW